MTQPSTQRTALLFYNRKKAENRRWAAKVTSILRRRGIRVRPEGGRSAADFAIAIGGDGTMLRAARELAESGVPLAGINTGGLGFLSGTEAEEASTDVVLIAEGRFPIEERRMLSIEGFRGSKRLFGPYVALNDCVVKPFGARAFKLRAEFGSEFLTNYFGDGLIASTPTGSTAYALSAMGPIVEPSLDVLVLAPICPHALTQRPLIVSSRLPLTLTLSGRDPHERVTALVSMDGQLERTISTGDKVVVRRHEKAFRLMVNPRRNYFDVLRKKLQWGASGTDNGER